MSLFKITDPAVAGAPAVTVVDTTQRYPLGFIARGRDMSSGQSSANCGAGQFVYLQGSNAASAGQIVAYSGGQAVVIGTAATSSPSPLAVNCGVLSATSQYGWAMVQGKCDFGRGTDSSAAAGAAVYVPAATDGIGVTVAATSDGVVLLGACLRNIVFGAAYTSSQSLSQTYYLMFPRVGGLTASQ